MAKRANTTTITNRPDITPEVNANFEAVNEALENTLSLDGSTPNSMGADIDMNNNDILNAKDVNTANLYIGGTRVVPTDVVNSAWAITKEYDTVADLLADTATYTAGLYFHVIEGDHYYKSAASGDVTNAGSQQFEVVSGDSNALSAFGFMGNGTAEDTAKAQKAFDWLGNAEGRTLIWDIAETSIKGTLTLPDTSRWSIYVSSTVVITQVDDNTRHFLWTLTGSRYDIGLFEGGKVVFKWTNNQTSAQTTSQAIGLNPTTNIPDGIYRVRVGALQNDNGYDLLAFTATAAAAPYNMPTWAWQIDALVHETNATGRLWSPTPASGAGGAPASQVRSIYIKGVNASTAPLNLSAHIQLEIGSLEIGNASKRMVLLTGCDGLHIERLRIENCDLDSGEDVVVFTGDSTYTVGHVDVKATTNTGASLSGVVKASTDAALTVMGGVEVAQCSVSSTGDLAVFQTQGGGTISLPKNVNMQTTSDDVFLYTKADAANFSFAGSHILGPFGFATVSGASFSNATAGYNGSAGFAEIVSPVDGFIVGIFVRLSAAITAGSLDVFPLINGTSVAGGAFKTTISSGQDGSSYAVLAWEPPTIDANHAVARGDRIIVRLNASSVTGGGDATVSLLIAEAL